MRAVAIRSVSVAGARRATLVLVYESLFMDLSKHPNGFLHRLIIDLVHRDGRANSAQHGQCEPSSEVLPELFEAIEDLAGFEIRVIDRQTQVDERLNGMHCIGSIQTEYEMGINRIERYADRYSLAVPQAVLGELFQFMGGPMAEIERSRLLHLKGIAAVCDVMQVHQHT